MSLVIYRPIKTNRKTQGFGENNACAVLRTDGSPVKPYKIVGARNGVCPAGTESLYKTLGMKGHSGEDWGTWHGEPLYFPVECEEAGGWHSVEAADVDGGLGVDVVSNKEVEIDGMKSYIKIRFWHMKSTWKDADVKVGELIGYCDNTGASGGDHLHWSLKRCRKDGRSLDPNNGYYGAEDFSKYFENEFILDVLNVRAQALSVIQLARKVIAEVKAFLKGYK